MRWPFFVWLIALPVITSPLVYIIGRLLQRALEGSEARGAIPAALRAGHPGRTWKSNPVRWISFAVLLVTFGPFILAWRELAQGTVSQFTYGIISLRFDGISLLLAAAVLSLGLLVSLFSGPYIGHEGGQEKYHALLNTMVGAMIGLGCAGDLFNLWVWFETAAVASYMLVAYHTQQPHSLEAGVKYLVQNSVGSMLVLVGIGLVFSQAGTLDLPSLRGIAGGQLARLPLLAAGALFSVGFGVKIAMVPMHTWLPDAHSQAPSGISAVLSGVVIETGLVALLRALSVLSGASMSWGPLLLAFGCVNMLVGNLLALRQTQVKRLLAFSSLSHVGYMLIGLGTAITFRQLDGAQGGLFHVLTHAMMKGLAFLAAGGLLFALHLSRGKQGPLMADDLAGAARRYPLTALALSVALLGLGGLPPFAGFMSKWQIFAAGFRTGNALMAAVVVFALLNSLLSLAYYAPLVNLMYRREPSAAVSAGGRVPVAMAIPLVILVIAILAFGVWPALANGLTVPAGRTVLDLFAGTGGM
ncbi:MAG: complex I subunit 5 family protein [Spirochaetia bacterium]|jgi:proton-translocating NADH-quinone oxidoreductase chain N